MSNLGSPLRIIVTIIIVTIVVLFSFIEYKTQLASTAFPILRTLLYQSEEEKSRHHLENDPYFQLCGPTWQTFLEKYSAENARKRRELIESNWSLPLRHRIFIWSNHNNGLGDRFPSIVSAFFYALATNRVLLIRWDLAREVFDMPYFNWTVPNNDDKKCIACQDIMNTPILAHPPNFFINGTVEDINKIFSKDIEAIWLTAGVTYGLFNEPKMKPYLEKLNMGLTLNTAYPCIVNALVPVNNLIKSNAESILKIIKRPNTISIGLHLRNEWDISFTGEDKETPDQKLSRFHEWLDKTEWLEAKILDQNKNSTKPITIVWMLVTDSVITRKAIIGKYGSKIIAPEYVPGHTGQANLDILVTSLTDWYLYQSCDYYILNGKSGFSRTSCAASLRKDKAAYCIEQCNNGDKSPLGVDLLSLEGSRL